MKNSLIALTSLSFQSSRHRNTYPGHAFEPVQLTAPLPLNSTCLSWHHSAMLLSTFKWKHQSKKDSILLVQFRSSPHTLRRNKTSIFYQIFYFCKGSHSCSLNRAQQRSLCSQRNSKQQLWNRSLKLGHTLLEVSWSWVWGWKMLSTLLLVLSYSSHWHDRSHRRTHNTGMRPSLPKRPHSCFMTPLLYSEQHPSQLLTPWQLYWGSRTP